MQRPSSGSPAFTLIELLVVIAIIAILSVIVILTLNPAQLLMQSRDSDRLSDLAIINTALGVYTAEGGSSLGNPNMVYISIPDPNATSSQGDQCNGLNLPSLPASDTYFCAASSSYRNPNGSGWIPLNFSSLAGGSPMGQLPQDVINTTSSGLYYTYATNGTQYIATALPESQKYKSQYESTPSIPNYPGVMAQGSNLTISPLWSTSGLVGYWPMDEGSGTIAYDYSESNAVGLLVNSPAWVAGKVGGGALSFNNSNTYITLPSLSCYSINSKTISFWANPAGVQTYNMIFGNGSANYYVTFSATNNMFASYINSVGTQIANVIAAGVVSVGTWAHYAFVFNVSGLNVAVQAYMNGQLVGTQSRTDGYQSVAAPRVFYIGTLANTTDVFNGSLDDVRVYNRALSAAEIAALYNAQK